MTRIAAILAGGKSSRMDGADKACAALGGRRLIDRVLERLAAHADTLVISGREDYGTGFCVIADAPGTPEGPAAGVFAVARWVLEREPPGAGFLTAPVDGPFFPEDLAERLRSAGACAVAADDDGVHPTYAFWNASDVETARRLLSGQGSLSLRRLAEACCARTEIWPGRARFENINTPADLAAAALALDKEGPPGNERRGATGGVNKPVRGGGGRRTP